MQKITSLHIAAQVNQQQLMLGRGWRSPKQQDIKDVQSVQRNSDVGSSSWYKTFSREGSADLPLKSDQDSDSTEKAELAKYAEALMSSRGATPKVHRKSASAS
ncbi:protein CHUP1 chloroplastic [Prunus yedoensis var. nudiflora]|uniref:Protein CHUP1 chloroplastic n=1 Tax=Prunus yedoensis var. nudiflora TaxID=2094558 RepID=A0A314YTV9_PRUYE|nr:protein CHUP1 chloroplastic [Prunus yedoensis var. nudiflora]